jgi:hypothetical protein
MTISSGIRVIKGITSIIWKTIELVLLRRGIYDVRHWDGLRWHDIRTKFHDDWFKHLSIFAVNTATVWDTIMLVLLIEGIYEVRHWSGFVWRDMHSRFYEDCYRLSSNIKVLPQRFEWLWCWYYWSKGFLKCPFEMGSGGLINIRSFTKIGTCVQAILRCYLGSLKGCHVSITDVMDSWWTPLKWAQVAWYTY